MKNIHLIPTDKQSKIYKVIGKNMIGIVSNDSYYMENFSGNTQNQNVYVTNDERIKVGDYITDGFRVWKWKDDCSLLGRAKVVLTNDQDLIADDVQSVDDGFLFWLSKNQKAEYVEVEKIKKYFNVDELRERHLKGLHHTYFEDTGYKIIYSHENQNMIDAWLFENGTQEMAMQVEQEAKQILQQETIEEVARNNALQELLKYQPNKERFKLSCKNSFLRGAKCQAERMYSEEEVKIMYRSLWVGNNFDFDTSYEMESNFEHDFNLWFEQFKKK